MPPFIKAAMDHLLAGEHPTLAVLRTQFAQSSIARSSHSGAGFFHDFAIPEDVEETKPRRFQLGDVSARVDGLQLGLGLVLFIDGGRLQCLEGFTYDEDCPETFPSFELHYTTVAGGRDEGSIVEVPERDLERLARKLS